MKRERLETTLLKILRTAGLVVFIAVVTFPFYWMIISLFQIPARNPSSPR
jgi:ABC-type glycerol-3-phosphate transport system permease component